MEFTGLTSASHMSLPEAGYGSEEGYVGSEISGAVSGVTTPGASRLQASQLQQRSTTMQRLQSEAGSASSDSVEDAEDTMKRVSMTVQLSAPIVQMPEIPEDQQHTRDAAGHCKGR